MKKILTTSQIQAAVPLLLCLCVILASVLVVRIEGERAARLPYTIGTPVTPASEMPAGMVMKTFDIPADEAVPTVAFDITRDSMGGYDVHVTTTNFTFAPQDLGGAPVAGEGHAHLYIDDTLIVMLGDWYHIDALSPGTHTIRVGLFNNDHSAYSVNGVLVQAQKEITVPK